MDGKPANRHGGTDWALRIGGGIGGAVVSAFGPDLVPEVWKLPVFLAGVVLVCVSFAPRLGALCRWILGWKVGGRMTLIVLGALLMLTGGFVAYQGFSGGRIAPTAKPKSGENSAEAPEAKTPSAICLGDNEHIVTMCLFLNSENRFEGNVEFDCARFPMLPESKTKLSVVSLSMLPRYTQRQLQIYNAQKLGELAKDVARELAIACGDIKTLSRPEKAFLIERLTAYANS